MEGSKAVENYIGSQNLPATRSSIEDVLTHLASSLTSNDALFLYVTNHGRRSPYLLCGTQSNFATGDKGYLNSLKLAIKEDDMAHWLDGLQTGYSIFYFNQCFSGGFAHRMGRGNTIALSTSRTTKGSPIKKHSTLSLFDIQYSSLFTPYFFSAFALKDPNGMPIELEAVDFDGDGFVSVQDAFIFATSQDLEKSQGLDRVLGRITPQLVYEFIRPVSINL